MKTGKFDDDDDDEFTGGKSVTVNHKAGIDPPRRK